MKSLKKLLPVLLALILCYSFCAVSFAEEDHEAQPYATLRVSASLTSSKVSAVGTSSVDETVTVSFTLYTSGGSYITSGSASGAKRVTASKTVSLSSGSYRVTATVSNGSFSTTQTFNFTI